MGCGTSKNTRVHEPASRQSGQNGNAASQPAHEAPSLKEQFAVPRGERPRWRDMHKEVVTKVNNQSHQGTFFPSIRAWRAAQSGSETQRDSFASDGHYDSSLAIVTLIITDMDIVQAEVDLITADVIPYLEQHCAAMGVDLEFHAVSLPDVKVMTDNRSLMRKAEQAWTSLRLVLGSVPEDSTALVSTLPGRTIQFCDRKSYNQSSVASRCTLYDANEDSKYTLADLVCGAVTARLDDLSGHGGERVFPRCWDRLDTHSAHCESVSRAVIESSAIVRHTSWDHAVSALFDYLSIESDDHETGVGNPVKLVVGSEPGCGVTTLLSSLSATVGPEISLFRTLPAMRSSVVVHRVCEACPRSLSIRAVIESVCVQLLQAVNSLDKWLSLLINGSELSPAHLLLRVLSLARRGCGFTVIIDHPELLSGGAEFVKECGKFHLPLYTRVIIGAQVFHQGGAVIHLTPLEPGEGPKVLARMLEHSSHSVPSDNDSDKQVLLDHASAMRSVHALQLVTQARRYFVNDTESSSGDLDNMSDLVTIICKGAVGLERVPGAVHAFLRLLHSTHHAGGVTHSEMVTEVHRVAGEAKPGSLHVTVLQVLSLTESLWREQYAVHEHSALPTRAYAIVSESVHAAIGDYLTKHEDHQGVADAFPSKDTDVHSLASSLTAQTLSTDPARESLNLSVCLQALQYGLVDTYSAYVKKFIGKGDVTQGSELSFAEACNDILTRFRPQLLVSRDAFLAIAAGQLYPCQLRTDAEQRLVSSKDISATTTPVVSSLGTVDCPSREAFLRIESDIKAAHPRYHDVAIVTRDEDTIAVSASYPSGEIAGYHCTSVTTDASKPGSPLKHGFHHDGRRDSPYTASTYSQRFGEHVAIFQDMQIRCHHIWSEVDAVSGLTMSFPIEDVEQVAEFGIVTAVTFLPEDTTTRADLLLGHDSGYLTLWEIDSESSPQSLANDPLDESDVVFRFVTLCKVLSGRIRQLLFAPEKGEIVVSGNDHSVAVMTVQDALAGNGPVIWRGHSCPVTAIAIAPSGTNILASGDEGGSLVVWVTSSKSQTSLQRYHWAPITSIVFMEGCVLSASSMGVAAHHAGNGSLLSLYPLPATQSIQYTVKLYRTATTVHALWARPSTTSDDPTHHDLGDVYCTPLSLPQSAQVPLHGFRGQQSYSPMHGTTSPASRVTFSRDMFTHGERAGCHSVSCYQFTPSVYDILITLQVGPHTSSVKSALTVSCQPSSEPYLQLSRTLTVDDIQQATKFAPQHAVSASVAVGRLQLLCPSALTFAITGVDNMQDGPVLGFEVQHVDASNIVCESTLMEVCDSLDNLDVPSSDTGFVTIPD